MSRDLSFDDPEICRSILDSLPIGLCVVDAEKKFVFWSDGAERISGHKRHEVIGRSCICEPLLHCDHPGCEFCSEGCPLARSIKTSRPAEASGSLHHKAGYEVAVRMRAVPIHNQHGSVIGALEVFDAVDDSGLNRSEDRVPGCVDEVTSVGTGAATQSRLREAHRNFAEGDVQFGVLLFQVEGLDHFRSAFGPEAANGLLRVIARTLESALWRTDFVGRWADAQFLVLLHGCREEALHSVRNRLREMLANDSIEWWGERRSLPVSIGHAMSQPGDTLESILERSRAVLDAASAWLGRASAARGQSSSGSS